MNDVLDLSLERLDCIEAPMSDADWGVIAGVATLAGAGVGYAIAAAIIT